MARPVGGLQALANELDRYQDSEGRVYELVEGQLIQVRFIEPDNPNVERTPTGYAANEFTLPREPNAWGTMRSAKGAG